MNQSKEEEHSMKVKFVGFSKPDPDNLRLTQETEAIFELEDGAEIIVYLDSYNLHWPASEGVIKRHLQRQIANEIRRHQLKQQVIKAIGKTGTTMEVVLQEDDD